MGGLPGDLRLRVALAPVSDLWSKLSGGQQSVACRAVEQALDVLSGLTGAESAPRLLADWLTDRLAEAGGEALVRDPMGWLLGRGLVQRRACPDRRCDDGIRLDTGGDCPMCGNVIGFRRAQRARIVAEVDAALPGADDAGRRAILEERLRHQVAREAEDFMWRRQQAEAEQSRREAAREAARVQAERERFAAQAADQTRQALPCADCGTQRSAGLCEACGYRCQTRHLVEETVLVAAAWAADIDDPADAVAVAAQVRGEMECDIAAARQQLLDLMDPAEIQVDPHLESGLEFTARQAAQQATAGYRSNALAMLARSPETDTEAKKAYDTECGRRQHRRNPDGPIARAAASKAAAAARKRTAQYLLATRLGQLRSQQGGRTDAPPPTSTAIPLRCAGAGLTGWPPAPAVTTS